MATFTDRSSHDAESRSQYGIAPRLQLVALGLAAGGIHLAMAPIHASSSTEEAVGFAVVGWLQILLAIALLARPSREVLAATIVLNIAVIGAYVLSRTVGLPIGAHAGEAETVEGIDLMTAIFEAVLVAGAAVLLIRPGFARIERAGRSLETILMASTIPVLVLFATSVALADPDLVQHGHSDAAGLASTGGHTHGGGTATDPQLVSLADNRCDLAFNPAAYWRETTIAGIDTLMGGAAVVNDHNAAAYIEGSPELDAVIAKQTTGKGELGDAEMVVALSGLSDTAYDSWLRWLGVSGQASHAHAGSELAPDNNNGMGGHLGPQPWHAMTDQAQCDALKQELALARDTALKYPTVLAVKAAGWRQVTPYVPGIAAHFMNFSLVDDKFEIDKPEMILYDGTGDDARVVGLSYFLRHPGSAEPTQGFTGNNDHYHRHDGLCVDATGVIGDSTTTEEDCKARGGRKQNGQAGWMSHAWVVPGCESPWGVFSGASPLLDKDLFANNGKAGAGCAGSGVRARYDLNPGAVDNTPTDVGGSVELAVGHSHSAGNADTTGGDAGVAQALKDRGITNDAGSAVDPSGVPGALTQGSNGEANGGKHDHGKQPTFTQLNTMSQEQLMPLFPADTISAADFPGFKKQVEQVRQVSLKFKTPADATAAGYIKTTTDVPYMGEHYLNYDYVKSGKFDPEHPQGLLFSKIDGSEEKLVGVWFLLVPGLGGITRDKEPAGFTGNLDLWHAHTGLCLGGKNGASEGQTKESCKETGGNFTADLRWMMHVWVTPETTENPEGVFAYLNGDLFNKQQAAAKAASKPSGVSQ